ncbi:hypothetical protein MAPG_09652 [Magnaporthiopsis poae ATCC 64411]|uniref:FYVE zinc finger protein n=1 Tax=Magnaporthiopsis poae (strain ATCC 64411 / 73-15) TaxID=644358 RepID=A0A0C4EAH9_MAGP6|nr:hypothetical protein MAPG_09652 [Magnaporthiopsis poae ATCC 64411]
MSAPAAEGSRPLHHSDGHEAADDGTASISGSSYIGSDAPEVESAACRWRDERYFDQECSRYFDCPSHLVERAVSEQGAGDWREHDNPAPTPGAEPGTDNRLSEGASTSASAEVDQLSGPPPSDRVVTDNSNNSEAVTERLVAADDGSIGRAPAPMPTPPPGAASTPGHVEDNQEGSPRSTLVEAPQVQTATAPLALSNTSGNDRSTPVPIPGSRPLPARPHRDAEEPPLPSLPPPSPQAERHTARLGAPPTLVPRASPAGESTGRRQPAPAIVLPRWQPDAEVTLCPICHTQFSIFVRKHHCRKCGRVVCNSCSPHRITIPFQFIVQPPGQTRRPRYAHPMLGGELGYPDSSALVGGDRVRLCNPCVPDPNTSPPQTQLSPGAQRSPHHRSRSSAGSTQASPEGTPDRRPDMYVSLGAIGNAYARSRSITMQPEGGVSPGPRGSSNPYPSTQRSIMTGTPPSYLPSQHRYQPAVDPRQSGGPSTTTAHYRHRRSLPPPPPQPQYQIAEEDECPVCHRELPRRTLPNVDALRESHITACIITHSTYGASPARPPASSAAGNGDGGEGSSSASSAQTQSRLPPIPPRRTGMFPYLATEKDCVDSAECTICLEEFEVGAPMARLECLCRFHHACISAWFVNHPGRCPVHQHDSFGY